VRKMGWFGGHDRDPLLDCGEIEWSVMGFGELDTHSLEKWILDQQ
jgi:hypothetical protein